MAASERPRGMHHHRGRHVTRIRPPVVKRRNWSAGGSGVVPAGGGPDVRARATCADFSSERGVRHWGLQQTRIEARSGDPEDSSGHRSGEPQTLRGLETHRCPPAGRLNAGGLWREASPRELAARGRGSPQLSGQRGAEQSVERARSPINAQDSGPSRPDARMRSGPQGSPRHQVGLGPIAGPGRRPALPCPSSAFGCPGVRSGRAGLPRALRERRGQATIRP